MAAAAQRIVGGPTHVGKSNRHKKKRASRASLPPANRKRHAASINNAVTWGKHVALCCLLLGFWRQVGVALS
ncbi:hypothetical protein BXP70_26845 [Hymenobacter crusticola]|uniref:Uncharacterized protein n=1 Tax=Hymenobacter crusticola TaxID=1770526 RepID=A0A243W7G7_9BACT|nr:hypothetical protein BXP70_26845 [Hymenobacter crusticola]